MYIFQNFVCFFFKITLRATLVFNLKTLGWFLLNFKGSKNKILEKSETIILTHEVGFSLDSHMWLKNQDFP